ncbi:MAG: hypothetical protein WKF32_04400 [Thermoleophilaceae bacterium]
MRLPTSFRRRIRVLGLALRAAVLAAGAGVALVLVIAGALLATVYALVGAMRPLRPRTPRPPRGRKLGALRRPVAVNGLTLTAILASIALGAVAAPFAVAHFNGASNSSSASATGPIGSGVVYSGRFGSSEETDYYYFTTTRDNVFVRFTIRNTLSSCSGESNCQLYATLLSTNGQQLGGEGSSAGTGPVGYAGSGYSTDTIDWTFGPAGRYILAFDSDGDLPTYQFSIGASDGVAPGLPSNTGASPYTGPLFPGASPFTGPLFRNLSVRTPQRVRAVRAGIGILKSGASARLELVRSANGRRVIAGRITRTSLQRGRVAFRVPLNAATRAALARSVSGRLRMSLRVRVTARGQTPQTAVRRVTVLR